MKNTGFSLVELIVVIAIMAALAGVAVPVYANYTEQAKAGVDQNYVAEIYHAAEISAALNDVDFDYVAVTVADGTYKFYTGPVGSGTEVTNTDFIADVDAVITSKSALTSKWATANNNTTVSYTGSEYTPAKD